MDTLYSRVGRLSWDGHHVVHLRFNDAPVRNNVHTLLVFGGLEQDRATVSFTAIPVVHT